MGVYEAISAVMNGKPVLKHVTSKVYIFITIKSRADGTDERKKERQTGSTLHLNINMY